MREIFHLLMGLDSFVEVEIDLLYSIKTESWGPGASEIFYSIDRLDVVRIRTIGKEVSQDAVLGLIRSKINKELDEMDPSDTWTVEPSWV